jgi:glycosyltransferase involved in cell wall biosynthesis
VSVVIPCYNYGRYVEEAVDSCLRSTLKSIEIIVVNDGSTDPYTIRVLNRLQKPKTRVIHQPNRGVSAARNNGIRHAKGRYILTLDADDKIHPTYLAKAVRVLHTRPKVGFVGCWLRCFGNSQRITRYPRYSFYRLLFRNIMVSGSVFRKVAWKQAGGYNERMSGYEDWDFWISLGKKGWLGYIIQEPLFLYRKHGYSLSTHANRIRTHLVRQIRRNHSTLYTREALVRLRRKWLKNPPGI